ncbi:protoporphyrinogen/coproporphyrinogen oxidase [Allonocardiopsis opalescens]|uniref:Oxygen-dependent protoporphyrinogen oxidase n=1 Tax=Allonocardiopsis opalescens TaxID=1144618 RepID=A0A2T0QER1_9ACTN|nr:FAD-dependent oxidoreductase [Allonocardiopsis opalescens]PRY02385.1 oxygen-dependent protoporphyrinogen oxidase [Allonocardiopsis opalescens]
MSPGLDVAVVGAGPAGLATAYALGEAGLAVRVLEAADAVGGRMRTLREHGFLIDTGAEMLPPAAGYPATWRLVRELGLDAPGAVPRVPGALAVWRGGRARPHAGRPLGLLTGAGLPPRARLDLVRLQAALAARARAGGLDADRPERSALGAATAAQLLAPYHRELRTRLLGPLAAGFFGWDLAEAAAAPLAAHLVAAGGTAGWRTYRDGMDAFARALATRLDVATGRAVTSVAAVAGGVRLETAAGAVTARAAVLAVPAPVAARLHPDAPPVERDYLAACGYAPMLRVSLLLDRPMAPAGAERGFAVLVPAAEDPVINVITAEHNKHPGRVPAGRGLLSLVTSPRGTAELIDAPDDELAERLTARAERFVPGLSARIDSVRVHRFRHGLPLATPRALAARAAFAARPASPVEYAGDWTALRPCSEGAVSSAATAAERLLAQLSPGGVGRPGDRLAAALDFE